jgi:hypothetical protein
VAGAASKRARTQGRDRRGPRRALAAFLGCLALLGLGIAIGSRTAVRPEGALPVTTAPDPGPPPPAQPRRARRRPKPTAGEARTAGGAVAAASGFVGALDGRALLDGSRLRAIIRADAASSVVGRLLAAYGQASTQAGRRLGLGTLPPPIVIIRAASVGYRLEAFSPAAATVSIWRVGIIGSGATVQPEQSWRTETVSLVWSGGGWKIAALASRPGPTPPLATNAASTAVELFTSVPRFEEFTRVEP